MAYILCGELTLTAVDVVLALSGAAAAVAFCKSFLEWIRAPIDFTVLTVFGIIAAFVASFCWFVRTVVRLVLWPRLCRGSDGSHRARA